MLQYFGWRGAGGTGEEAEEFVEEEVAAEVEVAPEVEVEVEVELEVEVEMEVEVEVEVEVKMEVEVEVKVEAKAEAKAGDAEVGALLDLPLERSPGEEHIQNCSWSRPCSSWPLTQYRPSSPSPQISY